jgi:hypothetical protein
MRAYFIEASADQVMVEVVNLDVDASMMPGVFQPPEMIASLNDAHWP